MARILPVRDQLACHTTSFIFNISLEIHISLEPLLVQTNTLPSYNQIKFCREDPLPPPSHSKNPLRILYYPLPMAKNHRGSFTKPSPSHSKDHWGSFTNSFPLQRTIEDPLPSPSHCKEPSRILYHPLPIAQNHFKFDLSVIFVNWTVFPSRSQKLQKRRSSFRL